MTPSPIFPPESGPSAGPDIPAWDTVARFLERDRIVNENMRAFWSGLLIGKRLWYAQVDGIYGHTIVFTHMRDTDRYGSDRDVENLVLEIERLLGKLEWSAVPTTDFRFQAVARTTKGFAVAIRLTAESLASVPPSLRPSTVV